MEELQAFGKRLKQSRENLGISQEELARLVGTNKGAISGYENGKTNPRQSIIVEFAKALNVSINWLITGYDNSIGNEFMDTINNNCQHLNNNGLALLLEFSNFLLTQDKYIN